MRSIVPRALAIFCIAIGAIAPQAYAQNANGHCVDKRCVPWGGPGECSFSVECDPGKLLVEVLDGTTFKPLANRSEVDVGSPYPRFEASRTFRITNSGSAPLTVTAPFAKSGSAFSLPDAPTQPFTLKSQEKKTFSVVFKTPQQGLRMGAVAIVAKDLIGQTVDHEIWLKAQNQNQEVATYAQNNSALGQAPSITLEEVMYLNGRKDGEIGGSIVAMCSGVSRGSDWSYRFEGGAKEIAFGNTRACLCPPNTSARVLNATRSLEPDQNGMIWGGYANIYCIKSLATSADAERVSASSNQLLMAANDVILPQRIPFELNLGSYVPNQAPNKVDVLIKNNSPTPTTIHSITAMGSIKLEGAVSQKTLTPGERLSLKVSLSTTTPGVKSGRLIVRVKDQSSAYYDIPFGGIVWTPTLEGLEQTVPPMASPIPESRQPTQKVSQEWGGDLVSLLKIKTARQFESALDSLSMSPSESALRNELRNSPATRIYASYLSAAKRGVLSAGARESADGALKTIEQQKPDEAIARLSQILHTTKNDPSGTVRYELLSMVSTIPHLRSALRTYTQIVLSNDLIDRLIQTNALGRFYIRAGYLRAYLATSPPLSEATVVVTNVLERLNDPVQAAILMDRWVAQYPEVYAAALKR